MVFVRILGQGLIPRNSGIAPRKQPFEMDIETIKLCLGQGALTVEIQDPYEPRKFIPVDATNLSRLYKLYDGVAIGSKKPATQLRASNPADRDVMAEGTRVVNKSRGPIMPKPAVVPDKVKPVVEKKEEPKVQKEEVKPVQQEKAKEPEKKNENNKNDNKKGLKPVGNPNKD